MERHVFSGSVVCRRSFDGVGCHLSFALELKINPWETFHQSISGSCMPELKDIKADLSPTCPVLPEGFLHCFLCCLISVQHPLYPCSPNHYPLWSLLKTFFLQLQWLSQAVSRAPSSLVRAVPTFLNRAVRAWELCTLTCTRLQQTWSRIFQTKQASPLSQEKIFVSFHL